jgi:hypothetical protein
MYRLVALSFLELGMAVVIVGYRTYPDADVTGQVEDLEQAMAMLYHTCPYLFPNQSKKDNDHGRRQDSHWMGNCLMGHSSGAHIALLLLVERVRYQLDHANHHSQRWKSVFPFEFDSFVGLSGPYGISHHFDYEAGRGVEEISPMKPACGSSRQNFHAHSPAIQLVQLQSKCDNNNDNVNGNLLMVGGGSFAHLLPRNMLLVHGVEDTTVPFTATAEASYLIRSCGVRQCEELYLSKTGHQETILQFMVGGKTQDAVHSWLQRVTISTTPTDKQSALQSNSNIDNNNSPRTFLMDSKL